MLQRIFVRLGLDFGVQVISCLNLIFIKLICLDPLIFYKEEIMNHFLIMHVREMCKMIPR